MESYELKVIGENPYTEACHALESECDELDGG